MRTATLSCLATLVLLNRAQAKDTTLDASFLAPKNVLVAMSFGEGILVQQESYQAFRNTLLSYNVPLQLFSEYLDLVRFSEPSHQTEVARYLKSKYSGMRVDLVICFAYPALRFWLDQEPRLFPNAPVLFMGIESRRLSGMQLGAAVTGLTINFDDLELLDLTLRWHPGTSNVFLAGGSTEFERFWASERLKVLRSQRPNLVFTDLSVLPASDMASRLRQLPRHSVVLFQDLYRDGSGRYFQAQEGVDLVCRSSNAPVYGFYFNYVGKGLVGGRVLDVQVAARAAKVAMRLLSGEKPTSIGIQTAHQNLTVFDGRQLTRWHIDRARLPKGSVILFEKESFWDLYKWQIVATLVFCTLETLLLFTLFAELSRRKRADIAVQHLNGQLITAQEEERARIARELHDDVGQQLAVIGLGLSNVEQQLVSFPLTVKDKISQLDEKVFALAGSVRQLSHDLHPAVLDHAGLGAALRTHCSEFQGISGIKINTTVEPDRLTLPQNVALCLYRISQEALRNVGKHSGATEARVSVQSRNNAVELRISDNGTGFDLDGARMMGGLGLQSMKERVRLVKGTLQVRRDPAGGAVIEVRIPLAAKPSNS